MFSISSYAFKNIEKVWFLKNFDAFSSKLQDKLTINFVTEQDDKEENGDVLEHSPRIRLQFLVNKYLDMNLIYKCTLNLLSPL